MNQPRVSVVMPTRNRAHLIEAALRSVLANTYQDFELILVDQGSDGAADVAQRLAESDSRVRVVVDTRPGASRARNLGAAAGHGEIVAFIDDDCEARPDWIEHLVAAFDAHTDAGVVCGSVPSGPFDPREGFIWGWEAFNARHLRGRLGKLFDGGISANMAFRREAFERVGGFDEQLGPGAHFVAMEDQEVSYRVLRAGYALVHAPSAVVVHYGFRDWASAGGLIRRTYVAIGAAYMKHLRMGDPVAALLLCQQLWQATANVLGNAVLRRRPIGLGRLGSLFIGGWRSFELDVDSRAALYRPRA